MTPQKREPKHWGLLTNHALVLIHIIEHPRSTLRDIADAVEVTERSALSLLRAMEGDEIVNRTKQGRRNRYTVDMAALMDHKSGSQQYSISQIASALFALSGRKPGVDLPGPLQGQGDGGTPG